ncbi:hypothetical protein C0995_014223 [Termitomyces sp. Mi166|nr:hypothetical protein C0995_014223 [Termitomyces sp. Mi166\
MSIPIPQSLVYKQVSNHLSTVDAHLDVYPPAFTSVANGTTPSVPAVIYFHGGGLTVGNSQSWFPTWLYNRTTNAGYTFISADYQLLPPATGHDILQDIQDVLRFVISREFVSTSTDSSGAETGSVHMGGFRYWIDPEAIAVAGSSAGGLCAYLAAIHCTSPKPKAIISMYGMGGDFFINECPKTSHYLSPKTKPFFLGREILDPRDFTEYLHPNHDPDAPSEPASRKFASLQSITDSAPAYHPETYHIPGYPANPRMLLPRLYLQLGVYIDYYTGAHENGGISIPLRDALTSKPGSEASDDSAAEFESLVRTLIPTQHRGLFPHLAASKDWPPTVLLHGTEDSAVPIWDSRNLVRRLKALGVDVELYEVEGREHSFGCEPDAEELFGDIFDQVKDFLKKHIGNQ